MIYIGNTFFELEIENQTGNDLKKAFLKNPFFEQLQFLPLLFLSSKDTLIVTKYPDIWYLDRLKSCLGQIPQMALYENALPRQTLRSWGASNLINQWANNKKLIYDMPSFSTSQLVNSKLWNFTKHTPLQGAKLVFFEDEIRNAIQHGDCNWVLKTDQGFSGRGHLVFNKNEEDRAFSFAKKQWTARRGLILEPWVNRLMDFSSQWNISKNGDIELLGLTKCLNTPSGVYMGTETGSYAIFNPYLPFIEEHIEYCKTFLPHVHKQGFFGNLGIDAMIYQDSKVRLHPVLEINARMTMSAAILLYHTRHSKNEISRIYYKNDDSNKINYLPDGYKRKLIIE